MEDFTIFQEMKDIVKCSMSQIEYEFHFFRSTHFFMNQKYAIEENVIAVWKRDHNLEKDVFVKTFFGT